MFCRKIAYRKLSESSDSSDTPTPTPKKGPENINNNSSSNSNADNDRQRLEALIEKASAQLLITASQLLPAEQDDTVQTAALRQVVINMSVREFRKKMTNDMELYLKRRREDSKSKASSSASKKEEKSASKSLPAIKGSRSPQIVLSSSSSDDTGTESTLLPDDDDDDECGTMNDISGLPSCDVSPSSSIPFASLKFDHIEIQPDYLFPANFPPNNLPRNPLVCF